MEYIYVRTLDPWVTHKFDNTGRRETEDHNQN